MPNSTPLQRYVSVRFLECSFGMLGGGLAVFSLAGLELAV